MSLQWRRTDGEIEATPRTIDAISTDEDEPIGGVGAAKSTGRSFSSVGNS